MPEDFDLEWEPTNPIAAAISKNIDNGRIVLPKFQRGAKWDDDHRKTFIDSLKKGFPFGSVLMYKDKAGLSYIIDGQQRCSTINEFINHPNRFFELYDIKDETVELIYNRLSEEDKSGNEDEKKKEIYNTLAEIIRGRVLSPDDVENLKGHQVLEKLSNKWISLSKLGLRSSNELVDSIDLSYDNFKSYYKKLTRVFVPTITYKGNYENLPEIFRRINSQGVKLDRYEIFAATWLNNVFKVDSEDLNPIVDFACSRYEKMTETNLRIADFDSVKFKNDKELNTFELCFGFGKMLKTKFPELFGKIGKKTKKYNPYSAVDSVGFNLINSCLLNSSDNMSNLSERITVIKNDLQDFLLKILDACSDASDILGSLIRIKGNRSSSKEMTNPPQELQIVSIVASIFLLKHVTFKVSEGIASGFTFAKDVSKKWSDNKSDIQKNIKIRYVMDYIIKKWGHTGDKTLMDIIIDNDYFVRKIERKDFTNSYDSWFSNIRNGVFEDTKVARPSETDKVILNAVTSLTASGSDVLNGDTWDIEHLCPKDRMIGKIIDFNSKLGEGDIPLKLPLSSIGNLCYLPTCINRGKEAKTLYEASLPASKLKDIEEKFSFTCEEDLKWISTSTDANEFKNKYFDFIDKRKKALSYHLQLYLFPDEADNINAEFSAE